MQAVNSILQLGLAIRAARKRLNLTQAQCALASGVGVRFLVDLEAGKATIRLAGALRVIHTLGGALFIEGFEKGA